MSLNAMHRSVMIFSDTQAKAEAKLEEIISEIEDEIVYRRKDFVETKSKKYEAKKCSDYCRGYRYQEVFIDETLRKNQDTIDWILMKLVPPHYYKNVERDESYSWRDHVHYFESKS